jgi:hypothetical protein
MLAPWFMRKEKPPLSNPTFEAGNVNAGEYS